MTHWIKQDLLDLKLFGMISEKGQDGRGWFQCFKFI